MKKFNDSVCSTVNILHDMSSDRHELDQFLFIKNCNVIVRKDFMYINIQNNQMFV
jgi:ABC-type transporter Mla maintaining outer membrane lipid asymmetry ATPase subunit MlaF